MQWINPQVEVCVISLSSLNLGKFPIFSYISLTSGTCTLKYIKKRSLNLFKYEHFNRYHTYGRKQRRTKEPLDESERGKWKKLA